MLSLPLRRLDPALRSARCRASICAAAPQVPKLLSVSVKPRPDAVSEHAMDWLQDAKKLRAGWQKDRQCRAREERFLFILPQ